MSAPIPKDNRSARGRAARVKGAVFEREIVQVFRTHGYPLATRTQDGRHQSVRGDITNGPEGVYFECKRHEKLSVPAAFDQVVRDAPPLDIPVLIHRPSRHETMATLPLDELLPLLALKERG